MEPSIEEEKKETRPAGRSEGKREEWRSDRSEVEKEKETAKKTTEERKTRARPPQEEKRKKFFNQKQRKEKKEPERRVTGSGREKEMESFFIRLSIGQIAFDKTKDLRGTRAIPRLAFHRAGKSSLTFA